MNVVIQIGNSDNKLTQQEWSNFVNETDNVLRYFGQFHFNGGSNSYQPWQNYCWVIECNEIVKLERELRKLVKKYKQDSIAVITGEVNFIGEI